MAPLFPKQNARGATWSLLIVKLLTLPVIVLTQGTQEVCQWQSFHAQCPDGHVIIITSAIYGRMRLGHCVKEGLGYLGCQRDVKRILDSKCSGRKECTVEIPDKEIDKDKPCSELTNYLEASYECRKVESIQDDRCEKCDYVRVQNPVGYLASTVTSESGCGSMECPWLISGGKGQYIRVSLLDFSLPAPGNEHAVEVCKVYAVVKERGNAKNSETICGGQGRNTEREVFTSQGPEIEIRILGKTQEDIRDYFMVKYEIFGCASLTIDGATISVDGKQAHVTCDNIDKSWTLRCNGTHWEGQSTNCTVPVEPESPGPQSADPVFNTTSLVIMATVAFIICILVVIIGIVCFKICTHHSSSRPVRNPTLYEDPPDLCHPPPLTHDTYCVTHIPPHMTPEGAMSLDRCMSDRCVSSKVTCKTYSFGDGQKNDYEHICDSNVPRLDYTT